MDELYERISKLSPKRLALLAMELQAKVDALERLRDEPVAIIGMGCRFPGGASHPDAFWRLLIEGRDAIRDVPPERWDVDALYDAAPVRAGAMNTRWGGFLNGIDHFDANFFGIAPREAASMDPQQRLLLEVAWEALEHAGYAPDRLAGTPTGVMVGICTSDYAQLLFGGERAELDAYSATGSAHGVAAGRLSYVLGLQGPSFSVDTACSSSLVAVHLACQTLLRREARLALAGGVNAVLAPETTISLSQGNMMASDGRCKAFDARADGFVRSEGCGLVVLKRLSDALADGDRVLAVIRGSAVNQDGRSNGLTAPNGPSQVAVIRRALEQARVQPSDITFVETHGTGTPLGDPIEVQSLVRAFRPDPSSADGPIVLGAVKTNLGHLEAAAGIAGLIKTVLAMQYRQIPPNLHFETPNPHIDWDSAPVLVPRTPLDWAPPGGRRLAGVSSFGFGGTNAHVILEEPPAVEQPTPAAPRRSQVLTLSARTPAALNALAGRYAERLVSASSRDALADVAVSANTRRAQFSHRLAVVASDGQQAVAALEAFVADPSAPPAGVEVGEAPPQPPRLAWLFTGHGSLQPNAGRGLYETQPVFREAMDRAASFLEDVLKKPLLAALYPDPNGNDGEDRQLLASMAYAQPAQFALQYALSQLWSAWGVRPVAVAGHSGGEYAAATVAGVLRFEDGLRLAAERGRLMSSLAPVGEMVVVFAPEDTVRHALAETGGAVAIAAVNGPDNTVISGFLSDVRRISSMLQARGLECRPLSISIAAHSPHMDPILDEFERVAERVTFAAPGLDYVSGMTGRLVDECEIGAAHYWRRHLRESVRFADAISTLHDRGCDVFLEIGPHPALLSMARHMLPEDAAVLVPSLRNGEDDLHQMLQAAGRLYVQGVEVDWEGVERDQQPRRRVDLPTYPFQRERYWAPTAVRAHHQVEYPRDWVYTTEWIPAPEAPALDVAGCSWVILADRSGLGDRLAARIREHGDECELIRMRSELTPRLSELVAQSRRPLRIVHLWGLDHALNEDSTAGDVLDGAFEACLGALAVVQTLTPAGGQDARLWIVTRAGQATSAETPSSVQTPLWGLGRGIGVERPDIWGGLIDLPSGDTDTALAARLFEEVRGAGVEDQIALRADGHRLVPRLVRRTDIPVSMQNGWRPRGTYLVVGGLGGLGLKVATWLAEQGARQLVLLGRRGLPHRAEWDTVESASWLGHQIAAVRRIEALGAAVKVVAADVADAAQMAEVFTCFGDSLPPLRGVFHLAADLSAWSVDEMPDDVLASMLRPKVAGAWVLHQLTRDLELDACVLFSSVAAQWGAQQLGHYAAANAFLDSFAWYRRSLGLPALVVSWGAWDEMRIATAAEQDSITQGGLHAMSAAQALAVLQHLLSARDTQAIVANVDWSMLRPVYEAKRSRPFFQHVSPGEAPHEKQHPEQVDDDLVRQLERADPRDRADLVFQTVMRHASSVLGVVAGGQLDPERGLFDLGMDSLMSVALRRKLEATLGRSLPATVTFNHPTVRALADYLATDVLQVHTMDAQPVAPGGIGDEPSEDDLAAALAAKLGYSARESLARDDQSTVSQPTTHRLSFRTQ